MSASRLRTNFAGAIVNDKHWNELVSAANRTLQDAIGSTHAEVRADWKLATDGQDRPVILLELSDFAGQVEAAFAPDELEDPPQLRYRVHKIWGDLLQIRSHKQLQKLMSASGSEGGANGP